MPVRTPRSTTLPASPRKRPSARRSGSASPGSSPGATSRSPAARSRRSRCPAAWRGGRSVSRQARSISRCRTRASSRVRSAWWPDRMLEPLYTAAEMKAAEEGHDVEELMQRAGAAVADEILRRFPEGRTFAGVFGGGANGGDGRIATELLRAAGWEERSLGDADVVIDALFGTGFRPPPRDEAAAQIAAVNESGRPIMAVDIPSGVDASTGEVPGEAVRATVTVTFHGRKVGHEVAPGRFHAGDVVVADIGLEHRSTEHARVTAEIVRLVPRRQPGDTKYTASVRDMTTSSTGCSGPSCRPCSTPTACGSSGRSSATPRPC